MTAKAKSPKADTPLELAFTLDELPSAQHRAGLAGLVLMHRWLERQSERRGLCELTYTAHSASLRIDLEGLDQLFDLVYAADAGEVAAQKPYKDVDPLRVEERTENDPKTGKPKKKTLYYYRTTVPRGAFIDDWDRTEGKIWRKLWRDMLWNVLRGKPTTRGPFESRAAGQRDKLAPGIFADLRKKNHTVDLPSTYYLGAQQNTAEGVPFRDLARYQFLLHFWPYVAQIYVPADVDDEGKRDFRGYAIAIPDVAVLDHFCDELEHLCKSRSSDLTAYLPKDAVIDVPIESALDLMARLRARVSARHEPFQDLVYGVEVFHVEKVGNNIPIHSTSRVDAAEPELITEYLALRSVYRDARFRRQRLLCLLAKPRRRPWYSGFDRLLSTTPYQLTIGSSWFQTDCRTAFEKQETTMNDDPNQTKLQSLIYRIVGTYINRKLELKYGQKYSEAKGDDTKLKEYSDYREKIAKDAFLAIRSRTDSDFIDYFSGTLCSVAQKLGEEDYTAISNALLSRTQDVRTLTLIALSARA